jgi:hypothetical protein
MIPVLTADDRELINQLLEDVGILESQFVTRTPKPSAARAIFAPILRRWIAEGLFYKAQKLILPDRVRFSVTSDVQAIELCNSGSYEHWMGLIVFSNIGIAISQMTSEYLARVEKDRSQLRNTNAHAELRDAKAFFRQKMFFWKEKFYTRTDVIKMQANALGGVHLDFDKPSVEKHIIEIKNYFGFEVKDKRYQSLVGQEIERGREDPLRRERIYDATELIAIDTARIFATGIRRSQAEFVALLEA